MCKEKEALVDPKLPFSCLNGGLCAAKTGCVKLFSKKFLPPELRFCGISEKSLVFALRCVGCGVIVDTSSTEQHTQSSLNCFAPVAQLVELRTFNP